MFEMVLALMRQTAAKEWAAEGRLRPRDNQVCRVTMLRKMSILDVLAEFANLQRVIACMYRKSVIGLAPRALITFEHVGLGILYHAVGVVFSAVRAMALSLACS